MFHLQKSSVGLDAGRLTQGVTAYVEEGAGMPFILLAAHARRI